MTETDMAKAAARSEAYRVLALCFSDPGDDMLAELPRGLEAMNAALELLGDEEALAAAQAVRSALEAAGVDGLRPAHLRCFGHTISKECPPYEAEYGQAHIFQKSNALADIAGFFRAFGVAPAPGFKDRLDHLSCELEFMSLLCVKEAYGLAQGHGGEKLALCRTSQAKFLSEHLGRWAFAFAERLASHVSAGPYRALGELLASFLNAEMAAFGLARGELADPLVADSGEPEEAGCGACSLVSSEVRLEALP